MVILLGMVVWMASGDGGVGWHGVVVVGDNIGVTTAPPLASLPRA